MRLRTAHSAIGGRWALLVSLTLGVLLTAVTVLTPGPASQASPAAPAEGDLNWTLVHNAPDVRWNGMQFVNSNVGYAVGGHHWDDTSGESSFAKTTDGGLTWTTKKIPGSRKFMIGVACLDVNQCWVAGTNQIWQTVDGGQTWAQLYNAGYGGWLWSTEVARDRLTVLMGTTGYSSDPESTLTANFLRSTNGTYFTKVVVSGVLVQWDIECQPGGVCNSAAKGSLYRSKNYGANWSRLFLPTALAGRYYGINCTDPNTCWMVGHRVDDEPSSPFNPVIYTTNGGTSWTRANVTGMPAKGHLWDVQMVDNQHGYAVGCESVLYNDEKCESPGMMLQTTDGKNWHAIDPPKPEGAAAAPGLTDLWVFGMDDIFVVDWEGNIWHGTSGSTSTGTPTGTKTSTATPTSTEAPTATPTSTETPTPTPTSTEIPTATPTSTETPTPTPRGKIHYLPLLLG